MTLYCTFIVLAATLTRHNACRGHGTQVLDGQLVATECGLVERVNKLVSVRPLRQRQAPESYPPALSCNPTYPSMALQRDISQTPQLTDPLSLQCARYSAALGDIVIGRVTEVRNQIHGCAWSH